MNQRRYLHAGRFPSDRHLRGHLENGEDFGKPNADAFAGNQPFSDSGTCWKANLISRRVSKLIEEKEVKDIETEALMSNLLVLFDRILKLSPFLPPEFGPMAKSITDAGILADLIASIINAPVEEKQKILDIADAKQRLKELTRMVNHQMEVLELGNKIQTKVKDDIDKSQRDYYLRQQLKAIKQELGETEENVVETEEYRKKIEEKNLPEEAKKEA